MTNLTASEHHKQTKEKKTEDGKAEKSPEEASMRSMCQIKQSTG